MWSRVVIFSHFMNSIGVVMLNETWEHYSKIEGIELQFNSMYYLDTHVDSRTNAKKPLVRRGGPRNRYFPRVNHLQYCCALSLRCLTLVVITVLLWKLYIIKAVSTFTVFVLLNVCGCCHVCVCVCVCEGV